MRRYWSLPVALATAGMLAVAVLVKPSAPLPDTKSTVVAFKNEAARENFLKQNQLQPEELQPVPGLDSFVVERTPASLKTGKAVQIFPNFEYKAQLTPSDTIYPQWYTDKISAPTAWDITTGGATATVAVIDTGFGLSHEDLAGRWAVNSGESGLGKESNGIDDDGNGYIDDWRGWDFIQSDNDPSAGSVDPNGDFVSHGTVVAGLVGATGNNAKGVASINWGAKLLPLQGLDDDGFGSTSDIAAAIRYAADRGSKVISMSLGTQTADTYLRDQINYALSKGAVVVAAAGNGGCNCMVYPANFPEVVAVGATDSSDVRASFSSYGANLDIMAPGTGTIRTTYWSSTNQTTSYTASASGTSISTPIVSGVLAALMADRPTLTPAQATDIILGRADKVAGMNGQLRTDLYGFGRVNARLAYSSFSYSVSSTAAYTDSSKTTAVDLSNLSPGQTAWLVVRATNTGNVSWSNSGSNPVRFGTEGPKDRTSAFQGGSWLSSNRPATLSEASVAPSATGTFEFAIAVPNTGGSHSERFNLVADGVDWMNDTGLAFTLQVKNQYSQAFHNQYAYTDATKTTAVDLNKLSPGQTFYFGVQVKNTGTATWYKNGAYPMRLGTDRSRDRQSSFKHSGWLSPNRVSAMMESQVAPNQIATFEAYYSVPARAGELKEYINPVAEGITWLNDWGIHMPGFIGSYQMEFFSQQAFTDSTKTASVDVRNLTPGQIFYFVITVKNTGAATWYKSGSFLTRLGTFRAQDHTGILYHSGWLNNHRITGVTESSVAPGQTGTFEAYYTAPSQAGEVKDYMNVVVDGATWLNDLGIHIPVRVQ